jgi:WhiB family redox-sensing transcriptional regulator
MSPQFAVDETAESWRADALCAQTDPEAFFPDKGGSNRDAKATCLKCDVREECLAYALRTNQQFGIWGGLSERERRNLQGAKEHRNAGKDECINGHAFTEANTIRSNYTGRDGSVKERRKCQECERTRAARRWRQGKAA